MGWVLQNSDSSGMRKTHLRAPQDFSTSPGVSFSLCPKLLGLLSLWYFSFLCLGDSWAVTSGHGLMFTPLEFHLICIRAAYPSGKAQPRSKLQPGAVPGIRERCRGWMELGSESGLCFGRALSREKSGKGCENVLKV